MPLPDVDVSVPFVSGLDTKTDRKLTAGLLDLENAHFVGTGTLSKRTGTRDMSNLTTTGTDLTVTNPGASAQALGVFRDELLRWTSNALYGYSPESGTFSSRPSDAITVTATAEKKSIVRSTTTQEVGDHARIGNYSVFAYSDSVTSGSITNRSVFVSVLDETSQDFAITPRRLQFTGANVAQSNPRVVVVGTRAYVLYVGVNGTRNLYMVSFDPSNPGALGAPVLLASNVGAYVFDAISNSVVQSVLVTYMDNASSTVRLASFSTTGTVLATVNVTTNTSTVGQIAQFANGKILLAVGEVGISMTTARVYSSALALLAGPVSLYLDAAPITAISIGSADGATFYALVQPNASEISVSTCTDTLTGVGSGPWQYNVRLAAKMFALDGTLYQPVSVASLGTYPGPVSQPTHLVLRVDNPAVPLARLMDGLAGDPPLNRLSSSIAVNSDLIDPFAGTVSLFLRERGRNFFSRSGGVTVDSTPIGFSRMTLRRVPANAVSRTAIQDGVLLAGGACPLAYDGIGMTEAGFHVPPEVSNVAESSTPPSGSLSVGTYQVCAVYEWVNALGQLERSPPSAPVAVSVTVAGNKITGLVRSLNFTSKYGLNRSAVGIAVYRTEANGSVFYRESSMPSVTLNSVVTQNGSFTLTKADSDLIAGEILYTSGGILDNYPAPPHIFSLQHKSYVFVGGLEDPYTVAYSLPLALGEAVSFNPELVLRVPTNTGKVTGFGTLDGVLVIFTERAAYSVSGDGPDATGNGNSFSEPQRITDAVGCTDWRTIVAVPDGLMHEATSGIHLLNRGFQTAYVGAGVEAYNGLSITKAVYMQDKKQVRFHTAEGRTLVWDDYYKQWSTYTGQPTVDAVAWKGLGVYATGAYVRLDTPFNNYTEGIGTTNPNGIDYDMVVGTSWLKVSGLQGYERARRVFLLGDFKTACTLTTECMYDYSDTVRDAETKPLSGSVYTDGVFSAERHLSRQKCEALRMRWTVASREEGVSLTGMSVRIASKAGGAKKPNAKTL